MTLSCSTAANDPALGAFVWNRHEEIESAVVFIRKELSGTKVLDRRRQRQNEILREKILPERFRFSTSADENIGKRRRRVTYERSARKKLQNLADEAVRDRYPFLALICVD